MALNPAFVWGDGGEQMTPERIAALRKVADAMSASGMDYSPVASPWQGTARAAQGLVGGMQEYRASQAEKVNRTADQDMITKLLMGAGEAPAASSAAVAPQSPVAGLETAPNGVQIVNGDQTLSPMENLDLKEKIKGFEGFTPKAQWDVRQNSNGYGTRAAYPGEVIDRPTAELRLGDEVAKARGIVDRRNPELPTGASDALTSLTFNAGNKWQGAGLGQAVQAGDMGAAKDRLLQYTQAGGQTLPGLVSRRQQEASWIDQPQGQPTQVASLGGAPTPDTKPSPQQVVTQAMTGQSAAAPVQVAQAAPAGGGGSLSGINPALIQAITSPYASEGTKKIATMLLQQKLQGDAVTTVDLGNAIGIMDKRGNIIRQVPKGEPNKGPELRELEQPDGTKSPFWVNPRDQSITPYAMPGAAQPATGAAVIPPAPPGVNPKIWRDEGTRIAADAAGGKLTEQQTNATQFANRMEDAERNLAQVEPAVSAGGGWINKDRTLTGLKDAQIPFIGGNPVSGLANAGVSDTYQKFSQAKSQFITALLRKESGAAISATEFDRYEKELFPQMGDSANVIAQKQNARKVAIEAMKKGAGPSYKSPAAPAGVPDGLDPKVWGAMTKEERALWQ